MTRSARGFTLLEVIVALVVFSLLLTTLAEGTRFALVARNAQETRIAADQDLDAVDRTLRRLVGTMDPGITNDGLPHFVANARSLGFTAVLPASAPFQAWQADIVIAVDGAHRLVLRWAPHYPALLGGPPRPQVTPLLEGLDHIELSYWTNGAWVDRWDAGALPELVRFHIVFPRGDRRHWPDVVAATSVN